METIKEFDPKWELAASRVVFPIRISGQTVYVHMKPYQEHDMMVLLAARATRMAISSDYTDIKDVGRAEVVAFFWEHFLELSGPGIRPDATSEDHAAFIRNHPRFDIERTVVLNGYGGVSFSDPDEGTFSLLDMEAAQVVKTRQDLYFPEADRIAVVHVDHRMRSETEQDMYEYKQASETLRILQRTKESVRVVNYTQFKNLYGKLIESIDGMTINGEACTAENKEHWLPLVPFWHKEFVLNEYFRGAQVKNAL